MHDIHDITYIHIFVADGMDLKEHVIIEGDRAHEGCMQSSLHALNDRNATTCYSFKYGVQRIVFNQHQPPFFFGYVRIKTTLDCSNSFHVQLYVKTVAECKNARPKICPVIKPQRSDSTCVFQCDCSHVKCIADDLWYLRLATVQPAEICEVDILVMETKSDLTESDERTPPGAPSMATDNVAATGNETNTSETTRETDHDTDHSA